MDFENCRKFKYLDADSTWPSLSLARKGAAGQPLPKSSPQKDIQSYGIQSIASPTASKFCPPCIVWNKGYLENDAWSQTD